MRFMLMTVFFLMFLILLEKVLLDSELQVVQLRLLLEQKCRLLLKL